MKPTRERKPRQTVAELNAKANERALHKLGEYRVESIKTQWSFLDTDGRDSEIADGFLIGLIGLGLSEVETVRLHCTINVHTYSSRQHKLKPLQRIFVRTYIMDTSVNLQCHTYTRTYVEEHYCCSSL